MKKTACILLAALLVLMTGCTAPAAPPSSSDSGGASSQAEPSQPPAPQSSQTADNPAAQSNDWELEQYQNAGFAKAPEYEHLGIGFYLDGNGSARDAYIPYGGAIQTTTNFIMGINHGVAVTLTMADYDSASAALADFAAAYAESIQESGYYEEVRQGEIKTFDNDTVGAVQLSAKVTLPSSEPLQVYLILYADIKTDGYMLGRFEFIPQHFDDQTPALLDEIKDCYAIQFPDLTGDPSQIQWLP